jgi:hypothetical protein
MKNLIFMASALFTFGVASAQTDPKSTIPEKPIQTKQADTTSTNTQIEKQSDLKTMDAVKTQDHPKTTRKETTTKDTIKTRTHTSKGKKAMP